MLNNPPKPLHEPNMDIKPTHLLSFHYVPPTQAARRWCPSAQDRGLLLEHPTTNRCTYYTLESSQQNPRTTSFCYDSPLYSLRITHLHASTTSVFPSLAIFSNNILSCFLPHRGTLSSPLGANHRTVFEIFKMLCRRRPPRFDYMGLSGPPTELRG